MCSFIAALLFCFHRDNQESYSSVKRSSCAVLRFYIVVTGLGRRVSTGRSVAVPAVVWSVVVVVIEDVVNSVGVVGRTAAEIVTNECRACRQWSLLTTAIIEPPPPPAIPTTTIN